MISNDCKNKRANPDGADHRSTADSDLMLLRMLFRVIYHPKASLRLRVRHTERNQQSRDRANFRQTSRGYSRRTEGRFSALRGAAYERRKTNRGAPRKMILKWTNIAFSS